MSLRVGSIHTVAFGNVNERVRVVRQRQLFSGEPTNWYIVRVLSRGQPPTYSNRYNYYYAVQANADGTLNPSYWRLLDGHGDGQSEWSVGHMVWVQMYDGPVPEPRVAAVEIIGRPSFLCPFIVYVHTGMYAGRYFLAAQASDLSTVTRIWQPYSPTSLTPSYSRVPQYENTLYYAEETLDSQRLALDRAVERKLNVGS